MRNENETLYYDSEKYNYLILKAYYSNDTTTLKNVIRDIDSSRVRNQRHLTEEDHRPILKSMSIDEGYQFNYSEVFCRYAYNLTIFKNKDSFGLHTVVYEQKFPNHPFEFAREFNKILTLSDWNKIVEAIGYADFWGLSRYQEYSCCDGNSLLVSGIIRRSDNTILKSFFVQRHFVSNTALNTAFTLTLNLAGMRKNCK